MYPFSKTGFGLLLCSAVCLGSVSFFFFSSCFLPTSRLVTFVRVSFALFFSFRFSPALGPSVISRLFPVSSGWCSLCPTQVRSCRRASHLATILAVRVRIPFGVTRLSLVNFTQHSFATSMGLFFRWFGLLVPIVSCSSGLVAFLGFTLVLGVVSPGRGRQPNRPERWGAVPCLHLANCNGVGLR